MNPTQPSNTLLKPPHINPGINGEQSKSKILIVALVIILATGGIVVTQCGLAAYFQIGSLAKISSMHAIIMIGVGSGVTFVSFFILGFILKCLKKKEHTNQPAEIHENEAQKVAAFTNTKVLEKPKAQLIKRIEEGAQADPECIAVSIYLPTYSPLADGGVSMVVKSATFSVSKETRIENLAQAFKELFDVKEEISLEQGDSSYIVLPSDYFAQNWSALQQAGTIKINARSQD